MPSRSNSEPGRFRPELGCIVASEACERFSYYGVVSILTLYLSRIMAMGDSRATEVAHLFASAVYFLPLFGGWLADRWLGRYWTILSLSLFYCLGHATLAAAGNTPTGLYAGLGLIALGAGGIKPCVSAFVGDQFSSPNERLLTRIYGAFYWSINLGAFFGFALIPWIRDRSGYRWAFGVPGIFMGLATLIFWVGTPLYRKESAARPAAGQSPHLLAVLRDAMMGFGKRRPGARFLDSAVERHGLAAVETARTAGRILMIFGPITVFWALFNQVNTTWVLQGEKMRPFEILTYRVDGERIQSLGALLVLILVPVLTLWVYPRLEQAGWRPTALRRMGFGMLLAALAFCICGSIQAAMERRESLSLAWQVLPYLVVEAGEVMVSATALEFAFGQAPASMRSMVMSWWLMTIAGGHFLVAVFTDLNRRFVGAGGAMEFYFYAGLMAVVAGLFAWLARRYPLRSPPQNPG